MSATETWTVGRLLEWTTQYLKERAAESPRLDAEILLAHARGCERIQLYTAYDDEPSEAVRGKFRELVKRRAEGTPVAYLVGRREFYSLPFHVTPDVLVPRPETEHLVIRLLDLVGERGADEPVRIVDVGVGSGVIAICAARRLPRAQITAVDLSAAALAVAARNAKELGVAERIRFVEGDVFADLGDGEQFDFVVSNPPYVKTSEMAELPRDVRDFEPAVALDGGDDGLDVVRRLVLQAADRLAVGGWLLVEIGPSTVDGARALIDAEPRLKPGDTISDLAQHPRVVQAQRV